MRSSLFMQDDGGPGGGGGGGVAQSGCIIMIIAAWLIVKLWSRCLSSTSNPPIILDLQPDCRDRWTDRRTNASEFTLFFYFLFLPALTTNV